jgi:hypothetical protein
VASSALKSSEEDALALSRRDLLTGVSSLAFGFGLFGGKANAWASVESDGLDVFLKVSASLTGVPSPSRDLGQVIYSALTDLNPDAPKLIATMSGLLSGGAVPADAPSAVKAMAASINKAWYLGVVGEGAQAHCVAFEHALNYSLVSDVVVLPTYARGAPHYWVEPPFPAAKANK